MPRCPVCEKDNTSLLCQNCGFDGSAHFEMHPTLGLLADDIPSVARQRQEYRRDQEDFLHCTSCGADQFRLNRATGHLVCSRCGADIPCTVDLLPTAQESFSILRARRGAPAQRIAAGADHSVMVLDSGSVIAVGRNQHGQCDVKNWRNIVGVAAGDIYTVGIRKNGTATVTGSLSINHWKNIVQVAAGRLHVVGLQENGTVVAAGYNQFGQCNVQQWTDIVAVAAGGFTTLGLKKDGTVVATGANSGGICNVDDWTGITAIATNHTITAGLRHDGTVIAKTYNNLYKHWTPQDNVAAISTGFRTGAILQKDGTVFISPTEKWFNIAAVSAGSDHILGLHKNGTVLATGENRYGQCNINGMTIHQD